MKRILILALALVFMLFALPSGAENAPAYTPGALQQALFSDAFLRGEIITADLQLRVQPDELAGMDADTLARLTQLDDALSKSSLSLGAGLVGDALRIELGAQYAGQPDAPIAADAALEISREGLMLQSSVLGEEQISARWETLLALAGVPAEQIPQILVLRDSDPQAIIQSLLASVQVFSQSASAMLSPYAKLFDEFYASLYTEVNENTEDDGRFPAAAKEIGIVFTDQEIGELLKAISETLRSDTQMGIFCSVLLSLPPEGTLPFSSVFELCDLMDAIAAEMTDTDYPCVVHFGFDADSQPLYACATKLLPQDAAVIAHIIFRPESEEEYASLSADFGLLDSENGMTDGLSAFATFDLDAANALNYEIQIGADAFQTSETIFSGVLAAASAPLKTDDGMPGCRQTCDIAILLPGYTQTEETEATYHLTAQGGEKYESFAQTTIEADGVQTSGTETVAMETSPDGPVSVIRGVSRGNLEGTLPYSYDLTLRTRAYDPAAQTLTQRSLETISIEEMETLKQTVFTHLSALHGTLQAQLPPELSALLQASFE